MNYSSEFWHTFLSKFKELAELLFERRDIILIAGIILFMIGLLPFMAPIYAVIVATVLYLGIKVFVGKRKQLMEREIGEGICADCGEKIINKKCPNCDSSRDD